VEGEKVRRLESGRWENAPPYRAPPAYAGSDTLLNTPALTGTPSRCFDRAILLKRGFGLLD